MSGPALLLRAGGAFAMLAATAAPAAPVPAATDANGTVTVLDSLSVVRRSDLDFGVVIAGGAGTVIINPVTGGATASGSVSVVGSSAQRAVFTTTGSRNSVVLIRIPKDPIALRRVGGTETMTVSSWTLDGDKNRKVPMNSAFDFGVGATLTVNAGQVDGTYAGTFEVTVQYP